MKKLLFLTALSISLAAYSQETETVKAVAVTSETIETQNDSYKVRSKQMTIDKNKNTIEYREDVVFITDIITLEADKVVFNTKTKEIITTGEFRFKGVPLQFETNTKPTILRYKLGDTVAYLE